MVSIRNNIFLVFVLCGISAILLGGFFFHLDVLPGEVLCLFNRIFGVDCPSCGLTRAFLLIPKGEWKEALALNKASIYMYFWFVGLGIWVVGKMTYSSKQKYLNSIVLLGLFVGVVLLLGQWSVKLYNEFQGQSFQEIASFFGKRLFVFLL